MSREDKRRVVMQLLRDRKNTYPGFGTELNFESKGAHGPGDPLTKELRKRWSHDLLMLERAGVKIEAGDRAIAKSQDNLTRAIEELYELAPLIVGRLALVYHEQAGDRELERIKELTAKDPETGKDLYPNAKEARKTLFVHDFGIEGLLRILQRNGHLDKLTARFAERMTVSRREEMEDRHDELYRVYQEFRRDGYGKTKAVKETVLLYRTIKLEELAESTVWRVLSVREGAGDNMHPERRRVKKAKV